MRVHARAAVVVAAVALFAAPGVAAGAELPRGPVTAETVAAAQDEATAAQAASTAAAQAAALAQVALDDATAAAQTAADAAAANPTPENQAAAAAASAAQAAAQTAFNDKSATAASAAADATAANENAAREAASFARVNGGTETEGTTEIPETDPFPDNATHSDNVTVLDHVRGVYSTTPEGKSCPAYNPTKCPGYSSLNFLHFENLGYDVMVANGTAGLAIWSLKDPAHPKWIGQVTVEDLQGILPEGDSVKQFWEGENMTVDSRRKLVFMSRDSGRKGQIIVDVKDPWNPVLVGFSPNNQGHTSTCLNDCRFLWSVGGTIGGTTRVASAVSVTDIRDPLHPFVYGDGTPFASDVSRTGSRGSTHSVDVDFDGIAWVSGSGGVRGFYTEGLHNDPATGEDRYATPYDPIPYAGGRVAGNEGSFMHNAYHLPTPLAGHPAGDIMLITNERNSTNCATAGLFIIASLNGTYDATDNPTADTPMQRLAAYSTSGKPGEFHGTVPGTDRNGNPVDVTVGDCSAHWFTVKGNIVALGNYEQGVRFVDISDPTDPQQVGWYRVPARAASDNSPEIISSDTSAAYWHGKYVYVSDYQRGVDVIKLDDSANRGKILPKACWNSCADTQVIDPMTTSAEGGAGGDVPATLSLTLGGPASFGAFVPGVEDDYTAQTTANVISTAGDATLSSTEPGHLMNGSFTLTSPLQVAFSKSSWGGPVSNDPVTITFTQHIDANEPLRTGSYSKTLTFTLSTTNP